MADRKGGEKGKEKSKVTGGRSGKALSQQDICVGEELKIAVSVAVDRFRNNEDEKELEFPSSLTANERAYVHRYCQDLGLISKSKGKGNKRYLTVFKVKEESVSVNCKLNITKSSSNAVNSLLNSFPVTNRDRHELSGQKLHKGIITEQSKILSRENRLVLGSGPHVPPGALENDEMKKAIESLPIYEHKEEILSAISENQVVFIAGETGSGKTTQVGKFILDKHHSAKQPCRIICTQPRRLSAISVAERVAAERGERVGQTVGYQVRLDSKLSSKTLLQFCTNGVLLRLLMVGHKCLSNITHIIVDEIHERDAYSDYLLISLRDLLKTYKKLNVILMSAALNIDLFKNYFGPCPFIHIGGRCFEVKSFFLEDVLKQTGYINKGIKKTLQESDRKLFHEEEYEKDVNVEGIENTANDDVEESSNDNIEEVTNSDVEIEAESDKDDNDSSPIKDDTISNEPNEIPDLSEELERVDIKTEDHESDKNEVKEDAEVLVDDVEIAKMSKEMDSWLAQAWLNGDDEAFDQIINLIMNENVHIDYQHSETKMTALIVASARGNLTLAEQLVEFGAQIDVQDPKNKRDALGWANHFGQEHVKEYLQSLMSGQSNESVDTSEIAADGELDENDKRRLELYHKSFDDQHVDLSLILSLIRHICKKGSSQGSILVFLPGYDDIISLRDRLLDDDKFSKRSKYQLVMLHSMMPVNNQRKVFGTPPKGVRKIILSTNIAETSITIDDVVYVIDSGKVKEKSHDAVTSISTLRAVWVSKASAIQRRGRAGRCSPGFCYHLFSQDRFHHFQMYQDAEILRVPIHDLCLQTKMLAPVNVPISDYLAKAPEPPSNLMIRNSIRMLKSISALDENEDMTDLGKLLVEIAIDPQLGKMIFMGMTLKCLEPAIIIACCSAYKEPFLLPTASQKSMAASTKLQLSSDSCSDQIAMLRAFQGWQRARKDGRDKSYCFRNFVSPGTMEMVNGMRHQILSQLRNLGLVRTHGAGDMKDLNKNSRNWAVIKAVVGAGLYPNFVKVDRENVLLVSEKEKKVTVHNSSVIMARNEDKIQSTVSRANKLKSIISSLPLDWLSYEELSRLYYSVQIRSVSVLSAVAVALVGGPCLSYEHSSLRLKSGRDRQGKGNEKNRDNFFQESDSEQEENGEDNTGCFKIDDWITFSSDDVTLHQIAMLRVKFLSLFTKHLQIPSKQWNEADDAIVHCIASVLTKEEQAAGLTNPATKDIEKKMSYERGSDRYSNRHDNYSSPPGGYLRGGYRSEASTRGKRRYPPRQQRRRNYSDEKSSDNENEAGEGGREQKRRTKRFFILKCNNDRNMTISFERRIWATTKNNEKRLDRAFKETDSVYLIFSIQGSGHFQGVAKMVTGISNRFCEDFGSNNLGGVFEIDWIHKEEIPFQYTQHLTNPWNDNKKVQISRDSQEVEPGVGEQLCKLWEHMHDTPKKPAPPRPRSASPVDSTPEEEKEESQFYAGAELYEESEGSYVEGFQLYSPPPFSPQFIPEFQPVPPQYAQPPPHMTYQQPYPVYAATGGMPAYRQQEYYQLQYPPQRSNDPAAFDRNGAPYGNVRPDSRDGAPYANNVRPDSRNRNSDRT